MQSITYKKFGLITQFNQGATTRGNRLKRDIDVSFQGRLLSICALLLSIYSSAVIAQDSSSLEKSTLPAVAEQHTILNVPRFGRYAVTVKSEQGVALQLVDRMTGPGSIDGIAGEKDGRLDMFLERGAYKLITRAHEKGRGNLNLTAHDFTELHAKNAPRLIEFKPVESKLEDFQQISFWLEITQRRAVTLEAAGRNLADMRLWKDGDWLVEALPRHSQVTPVSGQPLHLSQLSTYLEPGLYLFTLYGGQTEVWSETSDKHPLYIRFGIPTLNVADRRSRHISPFGIDRWLVPNPANYFRLALPEAKDARLGVTGYEENAPFSEPSYIGTIDKKSLPPVAEITSQSVTPYQVVTIEGDAGQLYTLQHFEHRYMYSFSKEGNYWISTLHSGTGQDSIDATSILTARLYGSSEQLVDTRTVTIDSNIGFQRKFNLLDPLTLYLHVPTLGQYQVIGIGSGVEARYKIEPFLTSRPYNYRSPPFQESGHVWDLDPGYYELTIEPRLKGILNLTIQAKGMNTQADKTEQASVASGNRYAKVELAIRTSYQLYLNHQPGINAGLILRGLPINLDQGGLPIDQRAGEELEIPVAVGESGIIRATDTQGNTLPFTIDNGAMLQSVNVNTGQFKIRIVNPAKDTISYSLDFEPQRLASTTPLPTMTLPDASTKPNFPKLSAANAAYFDIEKNQTATYNVLVSKPALYRLETSGLLNTEGNLRTRTQLSLVRQSANGVGRNFLIQQYLREGDYQLSIKTQGDSAGHSSLSLQQTKLIDNGRLLEGIVARYTLEANQGLAYQFHISEAGRYRIRSLSPGDPRNIRLEDMQGWPLIAPNTSADLTYEFAPGDYRLIILPSDTETRVISLLEQLPAKIVFSGHGPHPLPLEYNIQHTWQEPADGSQRTPDQWNFSLAAAADVTITLDNEMGGELIKLTPNNTTEEVAHVSSNKQWIGRLELGNYRLQLRNQRKNNRVEYHVLVKSKQLLPGQTREINMPTELPLSLGDDSLVELSAFATGDVRAWLYDDKGQLLTQNDDRSDDWNFLIARHLPSGFYRLRVEALDANTQVSQISFRIPQQLNETALKPPSKRTIDDDVLHLFPIDIDKNKTLLTVSADSQDNVGIALEIKHGSSWQVLGNAISKKAELLLPLDPTASSSQLRLRCWSVDRRGAEIQLRVNAYSPDILESSTRNATLKPLDKDSPFAVAAIKVDQAGIFKVTGKADLFASGKSLRILSEASTSPIVADAGTLWLAGKSSNRITAQIERLSLRANQNLQLTLPKTSASYLDIAGGDGPLLVLAESRSGQVGMQLLEQHHGASSQDNVSFSEHGMISTLLAPQPASAKLWNGGNPGESLEVSLTAYRFAKPSSASLHFGVNDVELAATAAHDYALPTGLTRLNLALPPRTAVVLSSKGQIETQYWSGDSSSNISLTSQASHLILLHADNSGTQARLELNRLEQNDETQMKISADRLYRQTNARSGLQKIPLDLAKDKRSYTLHVRGASKVQVLQDNGLVLEGEDLAINSEGILQITHNPGLLMAWLENRDSVNVNATEEIVLDKPMTLNLVDRLPTQRLKSDHAQVLHLYSDTPLITRLRYASGAEQVQAYPDGIAADLYLPAGITQLSVSAISGQALSGRLNISTSPLINISEGTGPERLLAAGGGQLFSFTLEQPTTVGIGLQASSDLVQGILMNAEGETIAQGVIQMMNLTAGRYVLAAYASAQDQPIRIRPVLIGTQAKPNGPPIEVIKGYLDAAGVKLNEGNSD